MKNKSNVSLSLRKLVLTALVAAPLATLPAPLWALPADQTALNGLITTTGISQVQLTNPNRIDVTASSQYSVIKWSVFGNTGNTIGASDLISYSLPTNGSVLNMVTGTGSTTIDGRLDSTGGLFIVNPNGITVSGTGVINASSIGLSTVPETEFSFLSNGTLTFVQNQTSAVTTGNVTVASGAQLNAASGSGNIWIVGTGNATISGVVLAGSLNGGNVSVSSQGPGSNILLASGGNLVVSNAAASAGNLTVNSAGGGAISIDTATNSLSVWGTSASFTTTGNANIAQTGSTNAITLGAASGNSSLTANAGAGTINLSKVANRATSGTLTANVTGGAVTVAASAGQLAVGGNASTSLTASTAAGNLALTTSSVGTLTATAVAGNITSPGNVTATGVVSLTADNGKNITFAGKGTSITVTPASGRLGNVSINGTSSVDLTAMTAGNITIVAAGNITQSGSQDFTGTLNLTANSGNITLNQAFSGTAPNLVATSNGGNITVTTGLGLGGNATLTATSGTLTLNGAAGAANLTGTAGNITVGATEILTGTISLNATNALAVNGAIQAPTINLTGGNITQSATITSSGTTTVTGNTAVTLSNTANDFNILVIKAAPSGATVADANGIVLGNATNATGNVTINASQTTAGDVVFGAAAADTISVAGVLTINNTTTANGNILDSSNNVTVLGNIVLNVAGTGVVTLDGNATPVGSAIGLNHQFGQVAVTTANTAATIYEKSIVNLGVVNLGTGNLTVYSAAGVINTGKLTVNNILVGAGTASSPGDIALNYDSSSTHNAIGGTITLQTDLGLLGTSTIGNYLARSLTVVNGSSSATLVSIPANVYATGVAAPISLETVGAANLSVGALNTSGAVTLKSGTGSITATNAGNTFTNVTVTSANTTAGSAVSSSGDLTVNGSISGSQAIAFTAGNGASGNLSIGSFTSSNTGATTFASTGSGKSVTDSVAGISIFGDVTFNGASIAITKTGHNFGGVTLTTTGNGSATIVESGTLRLNSVTLGTGLLTATSSNGSILETASTGNIVSAGNATFSAPSGDITLVGAGTNAVSTSGSIAATAAGNVSYKSNVNTQLGNITAGGGLTVDTTGAASKTLTQLGNSTLNVFGAVSFTTAGGAITVANANNRLGGVSIDTTNAGGTAAGANASIKELTTLNLRSVKTGTGGSLTATSEGGSIIDSGTGSLLVGVGGLTGTASFTASNGSITLALTGSDFANAVSLNAGGNVAITDTNSLKLGASNIGGSLIVTATGAGATVDQTGALVVSGDATFKLDKTSGSTLVLNGTGNQFGALSFEVGSGGAIVDELTTMNLKAGSYSLGAAILNTGGSFLTSGTGASTFKSTLKINAPGGTITTTPNGLFVAGQLTVFSNVSSDLSKLSLSGDLGGVTPINQGSGTYTAPAP